MKHRSADPVAIAASVRVLIEAFLHEFPNVVPLEFPDRIEAFVANIALWGARMNLTAHPEDPAEVAFHVIDSLMPLVLAVNPSSILHGAFVRERRLLDLGSGAGFPGLVLAAASPAHFTLVESRRKRASFLQVATAEMGLTNVMIEGRRIEAGDAAGRYDVVLARAFGDPADFFAIAAKALKPDGLAVLYANPSQRFAQPNCQRIEYTVLRRTEPVDRVNRSLHISRILAVWRK